jgi:hypothetical protein
MAKVKERVELCFSRILLDIRACFRVKFTLPNCTTKYIFRRLLFFTDVPYLHISLTYSFIKAVTNNKQHPLIIYLEEKNSLSLQDDSALFTQA